MTDHRLSTISVLCEGCNETIEQIEGSLVTCKCGNAAIYPDGEVGNGVYAVNVTGYWKPIE